MELEPIVKVDKLVKTYDGNNVVDGVSFEVKKGEIFILNMHISPYEQGNIFNVDPLRERKLLLHKEQIGRLAGLVSREGYTLVPLSLYLKNGRVKVALGICRGKKNYDKRDSMLEKAHKRDIEREMKNRNRY